MKLTWFLAFAGSIVLTTEDSFAQNAKMVGKCMRPDCASMQAYCEESKSAGKTGTDCSAVGKKCVANKSWLGTTPDGKKWSCTF